MKTTNKIILLVICLLLLVSLGILFNSYFISSQTEDVVKIGVSVTTTGDAAFIGNAYLEGLRLAQDEINKAGGIHGKKLELLIEDNKNSAKEGVTVFQALEARDPALILSTMSTSTVALSSLAKEKYIPLFISVVFADVLSSNPNSVSFFPTARDDVLATLQDMQKNSISTVGVLYINSEYGKTNADIFLQEASTQGIDVVISEPFTGDVTDFSTPLVKISTKKPEAIYIIAINAIPIIKQLKTQNKDISIYTNLIPVFGNLVFKDSQTFAEVHLTGPKVSIDGTAERARFINKLVVKSSGESNSFGYTSVGYDNLHAIAAVLNKNENPQAFVNTFSSFGAFEGVNGNYYLNSRNVGIALYPVMLSNNKLIRI